MAALRKLRHTATLALALTACIGSFDARAAYSCTLGITPITTVYSPTVPMPNDSTGSYTITCNRAGGDPANMNYWLFADNGTNSPGGGGNRVALGGNFYNYEIYTNPGYTTAWGVIAGTLNFGAALSATFTGPFFLRVSGPQPIVPAGTYTDTVTVTLFRLAIPPVLATTPLVVSVITTNSCQISVPPGNVDFTYTSFQAGPAAASSTYGVRCTTTLAYNMALDATSGTLLGLNYTLSVPAGATGTGLTQTHTINGNIAAGQAGTCATAVCSGSQTRTLTISW